MSSYPAASSLARALTLLERVGASGELEVSGREGRAKIAVRDGRVLAIDAPTASAPRLGDLLVESGLAADEVERIAAKRERGVRVGDAVVQAGLAGCGAVSHALRLQLRARVRVIARWEAVELRFEPGTPRGSEHAEPCRAGELLLDAMRDAIGRTTIGEVRARLGDGALLLTPLGDALVNGAPLWPDEQAVATVLRHPATLDELERVCRGSQRALRFLLALRLLEAAAPPPPNATSLALLARKAREIRRATSAAALLDLPDGARPAEARAAWRRLASSLHPDRFGHGVPAALVQVSNDVTCAINGAARALRAAR